VNYSSLSFIILFFYSKKEAESTLKDNAESNEDLMDELE
jgi:hypothetical protein